MDPVVLRPGTISFSADPFQLRCLSTKPFAFVCNTETVLPGIFCQFFASVKNVTLANITDC